MSHLREQYEISLMDLVRFMAGMLQISTCIQVRFFCPQYLTVDLFLSLLLCFYFFKGWGMWGNCGYACERVRALVHTLDRGKSLNEREYREALEKQYPWCVENLS